MNYDVNNICFWQVKPRTPKWPVHPILSLILLPQTASPAGMMLTSPNSKFVERFRWKQFVSYPVNLIWYVGLSLSSEHNNVACPTTASVQEPSMSSTEVTPRQKTKRKQKRKGRKKVEKKKVKQRQRHRTPSGVPEQESGCSLLQSLVRRLLTLHVTLIWSNLPTYHSAFNQFRALKFNLIVQPACPL